jgi:protein-disulfide isomerase
MGTAGDTTTQPAADDTTPPAATAGDAEKFAAIEKDGYIKGNKNARITIIEYSDLLCPFCKRHYNAQTIENLIKKYPNDVNMVFRQMPLPQLHPTAPIGAQGALCVGQLAGADKFYAYLAEAFQASEFTEASVTDIATKLGVNKSKFTACLTSAETLAKVSAETQEGNGFGVTGTPGNVIVDNEKGTFTLLAGAYPSADFEKVISTILGK